MRQKTARIAIIAACALASCSCAAPGTRVGSIAISGTVIDRDSTTPVSLEVALAPDYGFSRLDLMMSEAEHPGQEKPPTIVEIVDGKFSHEFPPFAYHAVFFILPPIGPYPRHPPAPRFTVIFSNAPDEAYIVGFDRDIFRYEAYSRLSHKPIVRDTATWVIDSGEYVKLGAPDAPVWHLRLRASRRSAAQPGV